MNIQISLFTNPFTFTVHFKEGDRAAGALFAIDFLARRMSRPTFVHMPT
jgi:hypothetical protein